MKNLKKYFYLKKYKNFYKKIWIKNQTLKNETISKKGNKILTLLKNILTLIKLYPQSTLLNNFPDHPFSILFKPYFMKFIKNNYLHWLRTHQGIFMTFSSTSTRINHEMLFFTTKQVNILWELKQESSLICFRFYPWYSSVFYRAENVLWYWEPILDKWVNPS